MTIESSFLYSDDGQFANTLQPAERLAFSGVNSAIKSISVGTYASAMIVTNAAFDTWIATANSCKYVPDEGSGVRVSLNSTDPVLLTPGFVQTSDATVKITWRDTDGATEITNGQFFAFNAVDPEIAPVGTEILAFERTVTVINTNRVGGDTSGAAWMDGFGVGGYLNALKISDQVSAADHEFYIGISGKPTKWGRISAIRFRIEFDVQ